MPFDLQENDLNEVVKEVGQTMVPLTDEKGLELTLDLEDNLQKIQFDRDKIFQVLTNLINNAIKFTDQGGRPAETLSAIRAAA